MSNLKPTPEWLRANALTTPVGVDRTNRRINGAIVAQEGEFKSPGRGQFTRDSLSKIVSLMRADAQGVKSRLSHATLSDDGISKFLGRMRSPRLDTIRVLRGGRHVEIQAVRADLHLSDSAFEKNPNGNLGEYVLSLAEEDPGALSSSLVLKADMNPVVDERGRTKTSDSGDPLPPVWMPLEIHGSDLVAVGDAVDDLLSFGIDPARLPDGLVRQGTDLLDRAFTDAPREVVEARLKGWLDKYLTHRFPDTASQQQEKSVGADAPPAAPASPLAPPPVPPVRPNRAAAAAILARCGLTHGR